MVCVGRVKKKAPESHLQSDSERKPVCWLVDAAEIMFTHIDCFVYFVSDCMRIVQSINNTTTDKNKHAGRHRNGMRKRRDVCLNGHCGSQMKRKICVCVQLTYARVRCSSAAHLVPGMTTRKNTKAYEECKPTCSAR